MATQQFDELMAELAKKHPNTTLFKANETYLPWLVDRYPTGIITLDAAMGGGIPPAGITELIGPESTGKTWLANRVASLGQRFYGDDFAVAFGVTEGSYDKMFARKMAGYKVALSPAEIAALEDARGAKFSKEEKKELTTQVGKFVEFNAPTIEELFNTAIDMAKSRFFNLIVIDSIKAGETKNDENRNIGDKAYADRVLSIQDFSNRLQTSFRMEKDKKGGISGSKTAVIVVNQFRTKLNASMMAHSVFSKMEVTGGCMLKHLKMLSIFLAPGAAIKAGDEQIGKEIQWKINKGKCNCHDGERGSYPFRFDSGVDYMASVVAAGLDVGFFQINGSWYSTTEGTKLGQGYGAAVAYLEENPALIEEVRKRYFDKRGLTVRYGKL